MPLDLDAPATVGNVRDLIRSELRRLGLIQKPAERMGLPVFFPCSCSRDNCQQLKVAPTTGADGEKWVNLQIMGGIGGVILDQQQRGMLADLLLDRDWYGDRADLRA